MANELIVNVTEENTRIVLLKQGQVIEYHQEAQDQDYNVGDIYLGTIKEIVPGLNAAFVDIGYVKDAFLAYSDLGLHVSSQQKFVNKVLRQKKYQQIKDLTLTLPSKKDTKIEQALQKKSKILVRIIKEPIASKPLRVSSIVSLAGKYLVLIPFGNEVRFSKKIRSIKEKKRLRSLIDSIKPNNFTVVVRKEAEGKDVAVLDNDLKQLVAKWEEGVHKLKGARVGEQIIGELKRAPSILRDALNEKFDKVIVDDPLLCEEIKAYIESVSPEKAKIVSLYSGKTPIFEHFDIEKQLKRLLGKVVNLDGGGHLIIEQTEAMWVIDVNSGSRTSAGSNQESIALQVNEAAMKEISRQMSLRGMGGIIIVDCISMKKAEYKKQVYQTLKTYLKESRTKVNVLPLTRLDLMQITRERVRPALLSNTAPCPTCHGTGQASTSETIADEIEHQVKTLLNKEKDIHNLTVVVHPYLYSYFSQGAFPRRWKWQWRHKKRIRLQSSDDLSVASYRMLFQDKDNKPVVIEP